MIGSGEYRVRLPSTPCSALELADTEPPPDYEPAPTTDRDPQLMQWITECEQDSDV